MQHVPTATRETIAIVEKCANRLAFYELASGKLEDTVALPDFPHEMARDPDGRTAYVGHYGALNSADTAAGGSAVVVVDLVDRRVVSRIDLAPYRRIHGLQCDSAGRLFVLSENDDVLLVVDQPKLANRPGRGVRTGGVKGHLVTVTKDGRTAFCSNLLTHTVTKVAPFSGAVAPLVIEPGPKPEGMCLSADESRLFVLNRGDGTLAVVDVASGALIQTVPLRGEATRIYRIGSQSLLLASYIDESLSLLDQNSLEERAYLNLGGRVTAASLHPSRQEAFASLESDQLVRVDLDGFRELGRFPTGRDPDISTIIIDKAAAQQDAA